MSPTEHPTPAAWLDAARLRRSCAAMRARAQAHGVVLRPHVKTHKCVEVAREQVGDVDAVRARGGERG